MGHDRAHVLTENSKKSDTILVDVPLMSMADLDALVVLAFDRTRVACILLSVMPAVGTAVSYKQEVLRGQLIGARVGSKQHLPDHSSLHHIA